MATPKTLRGADLQVYINGRLFAVCTGIRWQADPGRHPIFGIDKYTPFELAPGPSTIRGNIDCLRQRRDGGLEGRGVAAPEHLLLLEKYFSLAVVDRSTDTVILAIEEAAAATQSWQVNAKGDLTGSFSFEGLGWFNESEP
ncbi:hypothetical protein [Myxococcus phage Mx1]|nr:hypothetical protein [Myxococcus phage Mx1]